MIEDLKKLIEDSDSVLITSHISPDPDALSSVLLLGTTLETNFPDKKVLMALEELSGELSFLTGYDRITTQPLAAAVRSAKPNLIIIVDAMSYARCTRGDAAEVHHVAAESNARLAIIDHHEPDGRDEAAIYINQGSPAAVQDVYEVCFDQLGMSKPPGYAETTMTGLYSDTGGFIYDNPRFKETFRLVSELIEAGVSLEKIKARLDQYPLLTVKALAELAGNLVVEKDYSYSFISDGWLEDDQKFADMHLAVGVFANYFLRNIEGRSWGFLVYPDTRSGPGCYGVSFRAIGGTKDVSRVAVSLGGGGHKPAAGAKLKAESIREAVERVKQAVEKSADS